MQIEGATEGGRPGPLAGVRVLDLSRMLAGPYCTALLADLGAEVLKIEHPARGDDSRDIGPFRNGESIYFGILNRRKLSVTLNLKQAEARQLFLDLARRSEVVVENFRPGVAARLGIDHEAVEAVNPRIVYASISGFGQTGPMAALPAYDLIVQAASGLMNATGFPDGPPVKVGESIGDLAAGLFAAFGITAALADAARSGRGTHLDISMLECLLAMQVTLQSEYDATGIAPTRVGNRHPLSTPFGAYEANDGFVILAAANNTLFARIARMIGRAEMVDDPRFGTDESRTRHEPDVRRAIEEWTGLRRVADVVQAANEAGVPAAPIADFAEALASDQVGAREVVSRFDHPVAGPIDYVGQPVRFSTHSPLPPVPSPSLGAHTDAVLSEVLGIEPRRLEDLRRRGAV